MKLKNQKVIVAALVAAFLHVSMVSAAAEDLRDTLSKFEEWEKTEPWKIFGVERTEFKYGPIITEEQETVVQGSQSDTAIKTTKTVEKTIQGWGTDGVREKIKKAYKALSRKYHQDRNPDPLAKEIFQSLSNAYQAITGAEYDIKRISVQPPRPTPDPDPTPSPKPAPKPTPILKEGSPSLQVSAQGNYVAYLNDIQLVIINAQTQATIATIPNVNCMTFDVFQDEVIWYIKRDGVFMIENIIKPDDSGAFIGDIKENMRLFKVIDSSKDNFSFLADAFQGLIKYTYNTKKETWEKKVIKNQPIKNMIFISDAKLKALVFTQGSKLYVSKFPAFKVDRALVDFDNPVDAIGYNGTQLICAIYSNFTARTSFSLVNMLTGEVDRVHREVNSTVKVVGLTNEGHQVIVTNDQIQVIQAKKINILMTQKYRGSFPVFDPHNNCVWFVGFGSKIAKVDIQEGIKKEAADAAVKNLEAAIAKASNISGTSEKRNFDVMVKKIEKKEVTSRDYTFIQYQILPAIQKALIRNSMELLEALQKVLSVG